MRGIEKASHNRFCDMMEGFRTSQSIVDAKLSELEAELNDFFKAYQESLNDIKRIIIEYGVKQKEIRQQMKHLLRNETSKKRSYKHLSEFIVPGNL